MGENIFSREGMERFSRRAIKDLFVRQEQLSGYAYSETESLSEEVGKLSELIGLMYNILGVPIRDSNGALRDVSDVSHDLHSLNPKIVLSFQDLMQF